MRDFLKTNMKKIKRGIGYAYLTCATMIIEPITAQAAGEANAKDDWKQVTDFLLEWFPRLGAVVLLIGAIEFALAFKSEDPEGKTKGVRTAVAGAMVIAIPAALGKLLNK